MKRNIYDFDHTIYNGDCTIDFYWFCIRKNFNCLFNLPRFLCSVVLYFLNLIDKTRLKETYFGFLKEIETIDQIVSEFWKYHEKKLASWYLKTRRSSDDIIITASPEFLVKPICNSMGVTCVIGSVVDKTTGKFLTKNCSGLEKVKRLHKMFPDCKIAHFYSDSLSDRYLAELSEKAYIVKNEGRFVAWNAYRESFGRHIVNTFITPGFVVFAFCGGLGTLVSFVVSLLLSRVMGPIISYVIAYLISLLVTYSLNAKLVFQKPLSFEAFMRFIISYIPNFCILVSFVCIFLKILSWNKVIVYGMAGLLGLPVTYIIVKTYAFSRSRLKSNEQGN